MTTDRHAVRRKWLGTVAVLSWATLGLLWAQVILLQNPLLPPLLFAELLGDVPSSTYPQRFIIMVFKETSLLLTAFALFGLFMAALAHRAGARKSSLVAAGMCAATVAISLVPVAQAWMYASAEDISLSLPAYFAGPAYAGGRSPETVTYARPGGEKLKADVWRPTGEADAAAGRPAVIVVHGGGWRSGERGDFPLWNTWLASKGYVVFDIDYRLSPPPGWQDAPADVRCAVGWVKENAARYGVDPERVALMGRSAGGHLALLTAYMQGSAPTPGCAVPDLRDPGVAAVVAFYPPTDLSRLSSRGYLGGMDGFLGGTRKTVPERYRLLSPVSRVDPSDPPTFLVHGGDDQIVPPGQSELLADRLRKFGVPHRLVVLPWANHTFDFSWGGWSSQLTRPTLQEFLEVHLETPNGTRDDPARPGPEG